MNRITATLATSPTARKVISFAVTLFVFTWPSHAAYNAGTRRLPNVNGALINDAVDGKLGQHSLIEAAMIAAGATGPRLHRLTGKFEQVAAELVRTVDTRQSPQQHAAAVRTFLYTHLLGNYRTDASDLAETLENGDYNCVTASILYVALARRIGLNAYAVQRPEHVLCEVLADGAAFPVETTSPTAAPPTTRRGRSRMLTDVMLIATVYYNRGVAAFDDGDLLSAIELNGIALRLDPGCKPARDNLLAAINNRVVELAKRQETAAALQLLEEGLSLEPHYRPFLTNQDYLQKKSAGSLTTPQS